MKVYETDNLRNVALVGHGACGKTTIASAMLFASGAMNRLGSVEDGTAPTDHDSEEIERKISLQLGLAPIEWNGHKVNILDTPGYAAFNADAKAALAAADCVLLLVEAVAGVQVFTNRGVRAATEQGLPLIFNLSKMDRERACFPDKRAVLTALCQVSLNCCLRKRPLWIFPAFRDSLVQSSLSARST